MSINFLKDIEGTMKRLKYEYRTLVEFDRDVIDHGFLLRCLPRDDDRQHPEYSWLEVWPETEVKGEPDFWNNMTVQGFDIKPHHCFCFRSWGEVTVDLSRPRKEWHPIFCYPTKFTQTSPAMEALTKKLLGKNDSEGRWAGSNALSKALCLMNGLYNVFEYRTGVTRTATTAEEAFALGQGVCQDYAHMLAAMCLYAKIPARYVAGFMLGEGYTHAWVEIFSEGSWYGLDPTNNLMVDETYIKLAHGRNALDCSVLRGGFKGSVCQSQEIFVHVEEV